MVEEMAGGVMQYFALSQSIFHTVMIIRESTLKTLSRYVEESC